jgi:hypothetical protein
MGRFDRRHRTTIAGERGGVMRDMKDGRKIIVSFRELQNDAKKTCFIRTE